MLLNSELYDFLPNFVIEQSPLKIIISYFHHHEGPTLLEEIDDSISIASILFPDSWEDNSIFISKHGIYYYLAICVLSNEIFSPRGNLQITLSLRGLQSSFNDLHINYLLEKSIILRNSKELNLNLLNQLNLLNNFQFPSLITHPISNFLKNGLICSIFKNNINELFYLWKIRILNFKIIISNNKNLTYLTHLTYFLSIISYPLQNFENISFLFSLSNINEFLEKNWNICCITHPILKEKKISHITILENLKIQYNQDFNSILKGKFLNISKLQNILNSNDDLELINFFLLLNFKLKNLIYNNQIINNNDINEIGLDSGNKNFLSLLIYQKNINSILELNNCCC